MSILTIRSWFENKGCQVLLVIVGAAVGLGLVGTTFSGFFTQGQPGANREAVLVEFSGQKVTDEEVQTKLEEYRRLSMGFDNDPKSKLDLAAGVVYEVLQVKALNSLAAKRNVVVTDDLIKKSAADQVEGQLLQAQMGLKLKPNATEKEIDEAFKKQFQKDRAGLRKDSQDTVAKNLKDPKMREQMAAQLLGKAVADSFTAGISVSDDEIKAGFTTLTMHRLAFAQVGVSQDERLKQADEARLALAQGTPVNQVYQKYFKADAPAPIQYSPATLEADPQKKPLTSLAEKGVSEVLDEAGTPVVYQLVKRETKLPADFEKTKSAMADGIKQRKAGEALQKELEAIVAPASMMWKSKTAELMYDYAKATLYARSATPPNWKDFADRAKKLQEEGPSQNLDLLRYVALDNLMKSASAAEQTKLKEELAEAAAGALISVENRDLRLRLADLYFDLKKAEEAHAQYLMTAENLVSYEAADEAFVKQFESKVAGRERDKSLTADQAKEVRVLLEKWKKDKIAYRIEAEKARIELEAEQKKLAEEEKKRLEAEKKQLEEADKQAKK